MPALTGLPQRFTSGFLVDVTSKDAVRAMADQAVMDRKAFEAAIGAIDPLRLYRTSGYRAEKAKERPVSGVASAGII
jgi:L-rhamnose isomerase